MRQQLVIDNLSRDDLEDMLTKVMNPPPDPELEKILNCTVDRAFIRRNLDISLRQILNYEQQGILNPVRYGESESCSAYYRLTDILNLLSLKKI